MARSNPPEPHQIIDIGKLEGAIERPRTADLVELAVSTFKGIAHAHAFIQGNKSTAWKTSVLFLKANGATVDPAVDGDVFGRFLVRFVAGEIPKESVDADIMIAPTAARSHADRCQFIEGEGGVRRNLRLVGSGGGSDPGAEGNGKGDTSRRGKAFAPFTLPELIKRLASDRLSHTFTGVRLLADR